MAEHHLHDVDLEVTAELTDLEADKLSVSVRLTVWCRGLNNECGWFFDVPDSIDNTGIAQVALHLTPELLSELAESHRQYWQDASDGQGNHVFDSSTRVRVASLGVER